MQWMLWWTWSSWGSEDQNINPDPCGDICRADRQISLWQAVTDDPLSASVQIPNTGPRLADTRWRISWIVQGDEKRVKWNQQGNSFGKSNCDRGDSILFPWAVGCWYLTWSWNIRISRQQLKAQQPTKKKMLLQKKILKIKSLRKQNRGSQGNRDTSLSKSFWIAERGRCFSFFMAVMGFGLSDNMPRRLSRLNQRKTQCPTMLATRRERQTMTKQKILEALSRIGRACLTLFCRRHGGGLVYGG